MIPSDSRNRSRAKVSGSAVSSCRASSRFMDSRFRGNDEKSKSELWKRHALLPHIFAGAVGVADFARFVSLEEQELTRAFVGIDLGRKGRGVGKFERHMPLPAGLERRDVHNDPAPRISRFAEAD